MAPSMARGVLYLVWGTEIEPVLKRSLASVKKEHPELPIEVVRLPMPADPGQGLLEKARMMERSPFDETLYLDADTVVMDRLDFGFEQAKRTGLACCICEAPYARRYAGLPNDDAIEYNTGVLFFTRKSKPVFDAWIEYATTVDSSIMFRGADGRMQRMPSNDQAGFAKAVAEWESIPAVLPMNWNLRPTWQRSWFGPVKVWHGYEFVPPAVLQRARYYRQSNAVIQFHHIDD